MGKAIHIYAKLLFSSALLPLPLCPLLRHLLPPLYPPFRPYASKHQRNPDPLHAGQPVSKPKHAKHHAQHLPRDRDRNQQQARELAQGIVYKNLSKSPAHRKAQNILEHTRIAIQKRQRRGKLRRVLLWYESQQRRPRQIRRKQQIRRRQHRRQHILRHHHLRRRVRPIRAEDVILRRVRKPIKQQINPQQPQSPQLLSLHHHRLRRLFPRARMI